MLNNTWYCQLVSKVSIASSIVSNVAVLCNENIVNRLVIVTIIKIIIILKQTTTIIKYLNTGASKRRSEECEVVSYVFLSCTRCKILFDLFNFYSLNACFEEWIPAFAIPKLNFLFDIFQSKCFPLFVYNRKKKHKKAVYLTLREGSWRMNGVPLPLFKSGSGLRWASINFCKTLTISCKILRFLTDSLDMRSAKFTDTNTKLKNVSFPQNWNKTQLICSIVSELIARGLIKAFSQV